VKSDEATKKNRGSWFLWWQINPAELDEQVSKYETLSLIRSARGAAVFCLLFSIIATIVLISLGHDLSSLFDVALFAILAVFIYLGHRWAMISAMALWTLEKGFAFTVMFGAKPNGAGFAVQIVWWCIYMHAFFLAFRVEQERRRKMAIPAMPQGETPAN
jgi:hypothetical protein